MEEPRDPTLDRSEAFVGCILHGEVWAVRVTYPDAVKTLAVVLAANESHQTGLPVSLEKCGAR